MDDIIRNSFTKYVQVAIKRKRKDYMKKLYYIRNGEGEDAVYIEEFHISFEEGYWKYVNERIHTCLRNPAELRRIFAEVLDADLAQALMKLKNRELLVITARVFGQESFREIGERYLVEEKQISYMYHYIRKKIRKELKKNGI